MQLNIFAAHHAASQPKRCVYCCAGPGDLESAALLVGFPAVIKPIAAAASMGVVRVDNLQELRDKVAATQKQLESLYLDEHVSGAGWTLLFWYFQALRLPLL